MKSSEDLTDTTVNPDAFKFCPHAEDEFAFEQSWAEFKTIAADLFLTSSLRSQAGIRDVIHLPEGASPSRSAADPLADERWGESHAWDIGHLNDLITRNMQCGSSRLVMLDGFAALGEIQVTLEMFHAICALNQVSPFYLKLVTGLGSKRPSSDENFMACYSRFSSTSISKESGFNNSKGKAGQDWLAAELCYNVFHFEHDGPMIDGPWSSRHSVLYHKYCFASNRSCWIIIQTPLLFSKRFKPGKLFTTTHPMSLHIRYLDASIACWRAYLAHIACNLDELNEEVSTTKHGAEGEINASVNEQLEPLQERLHHSHAVLTSTLNTLATVSRHENVLVEKANLSASVHTGFQHEIQILTNEVQLHVKTTDKLLVLSENIRLMMFSNTPKHHGAVETENMLSVTYRVIQRHVATILATCCSHLQLVKSEFSTLLVWIRTNINEGPSGRQNLTLKIDQELRVSIVFIIFAIVISWLWGRWQKQAAEGM
ncbi:uncharacterized protein BJX67DRAFT_80902 [Aspergillus lucknowensis]|uniref:CorA-like transporter domain-containing protein n=1 Tax=Aspergillus lucknowensis TaxID=176173 RepID=A0ABR4LSW3_9EURO